MTSDAFAVTFDERWSSMFGVNVITSESVSAKAELVRSDDLRESKVRSREARRESHARRGRGYRSRGYRHREWYKGGRKWHYVYTRRSRR